MRKRLAGGDDPTGVVAHEVEWRAWLEALAEITRSVNESRPIRWVLELIAETSCRLTEFDYSAVQLANASRTQLTIEGASGLSAAYIERVNSDRPIGLEPGEYYGSPSSRAFRSGVPVSIEDAYTDPSFAPWKGIAAEQGYRSLFAVPLIYHGEAIGVLASYKAEPYRVGPDVEELLKILADQAATAIQAAKLRASQQQRISELRAINNSLDEKTRLLEQAEQIHHRLMEAALRGGGLEEIAETLAHLAESPVLIEDMYGELLASADRDGVNLPAVAQEGTDPATERALEELETEKRTVAFDAATTFGGPHATRLLVPIVIDGEIAGRLWASVGWDDATSLRRHALERGAIIIALELLRHRTEQTWRWRHTRDLALDLISSDVEDESADLKARAASLGHDLAIPHLVIAARLDPEERPDDEIRDSGKRDDTEAVLHFAQQLVPSERPRPLVGRSRRSLFLFWPVEDGELGHLRFLHDLRNLVAGRIPGGRSLTVVVGGEARDLSDYGRLFQTAEGGLRLMQEAGRRDELIGIEHLGMYQPLLQTNATADLVSFTKNVIGPLREHDARTSGQLQATIRTYLKKNCSVKATAKALFVHPNTVAYRLQLIGRMLNLDLKAPPDLLQLQWALMVDDIVALDSRQAT